MPNPPYKGPLSPITGMFFIVLGRNPIIITIDGAKCVPIFSEPHYIADAERWFNLPRGRVLEITDGYRFWQAFHHDFRIVRDPRMVDGQARYDEIEMDPLPKEVH